MMASVPNGAPRAETVLSQAQIFISEEFERLLDCNQQLALENAIFTLESVSITCFSVSTNQIQFGEAGMCQKLSRLLSTFLDRLSSELRHRSCPSPAIATTTSAVDNAGHGDLDSLLLLLLLRCCAQALDALIALVSGCPSNALRLADVIGIAPLLISSVSAGKEEALKYVAAATIVDDTLADDLDLMAMDRRDLQLLPTSAEDLFAMGRSASEDDAPFELVDSSLAYEKLIHTSSGLRVATAVESAAAVSQLLPAACLQLLENALRLMENLALVPALRSEFGTLGGIELVLGVLYALGTSEHIAVAERSFAVLSNLTSACSRNQLTFVRAGGCEGLLLVLRRHGSISAAIADFGLWTIQNLILSSSASPAATTAVLFVADNASKKSNVPPLLLGGVTSSIDNNQGSTEALLRFMEISDTVDVLLMLLTVHGQSSSAVAESGLGALWSLLEFSRRVLLAVAAGNGSDCTSVLEDAVRKKADCVVLRVFCSYGSDSVAVALRGMQLLLLMATHMARSQMQQQQTSVGGVAVLQSHTSASPLAESADPGIEFLDFWRVKRRLHGKTGAAAVRIVDERGHDALKLATKSEVVVATWGGDSGVQQQQKQMRRGMSSFSGSRVTSQRNQRSGSDVSSNNSSSSIVRRVSSVQELSAVERTAAASSSRFTAWRWALHLLHRHGASSIPLLSCCSSLLLVLAQRTAENWELIAQHNGCSILYHAIRENKFLNHHSAAVAVTDSVLHREIDYSGGADDAERLSCCEAAVEVLLALANSLPNNRSELGKLGAHDVVIEMLHSWGQRSTHLTELGLQTFVLLFPEAGAAAVNEESALACSTVLLLLSHPSSSTATAVATTAESARVVEYGLWALKLLAAIEPNCVSLGRQGACPLLVQLLRRHAHSAHIVRRGLDCIANLAAADTNQSKLAKAGACKLLSDVLRDRSRSHFSTILSTAGGSNVDLELVVQGLRAVQALAAHQKAMLGELGLCETVQQLLVSRLPAHALTGSGIGTGGFNASQQQSVADIGSSLSVSRFNDSISTLRSPAADDCELSEAQAEALNVFISSMSMAVFNLTYQSTENKRRFQQMGLLTLLQQILNQRWLSHPTRDELKDAVKVVQF